MAPLPPVGRVGSQRLPAPDDGLSRLLEDVQRMVDGVEHINQLVISLRAREPVPHAPKPPEEIRRRARAARACYHHAVEDADPFTVVLTSDLAAVFYLLRLLDKASL